MRREKMARQVVSRAVSSPDPHSTSVCASRCGQMLSAQSRGPSAARERLSWLAVTTAERVFSLAWSSVKWRPRQISG